MAKGKGKEVQSVQGNGAGEDQQRAVVTRSRGQSSAAGRINAGNPSRQQGESSDPIRVGDSEAVHSPSLNRPDLLAAHRSDQAPQLRSDPTSYLRSDPMLGEAGTSTRVPANAPIPAARVGDQVNPSAPITQGDFSRLLDMLESTREAMRVHERTNLMMQENMRLMSREINELRRQRTPSPVRHTPVDQSSSSEEERPRERRPLERPQNVEQLTFGSLGSREDIARALGNDSPPRGQRLQSPLPEIDRERRERNRAEAARRRRASPEHEPRRSSDTRAREPEQPLTSADVQAMVRRIMSESRNYTNEDYGIERSHTPFTDDILDFQFPRRFNLP